MMTCDSEEFAALKARAKAMEDETDIVVMRQFALELKARIEVLFKENEAAEMETQKLKAELKRRKAEIRKRRVRAARHMPKTQG
ncbi:MAG: hypothetical protein STSR0009_09970 [Methanoregula sp.]